MNKSVFLQAQEAYENGDFSAAFDLFHSVASDQNNQLSPGEFGLVYHQLGNCLIKMNNYKDAITAYTNASTDAAYISIGTVFYNLGMAYAYLSDFGNAINNFETAIKTPNYRAKYKAYTAMGNALMRSGKPAEAGVVFRKAALDQHNPDPTRALLNLGVCFMALRRSNDAVEVYKNAFQFNMPSDMRNRLNANLGQAYVASGQMKLAVEAFENALRDKTYVLSDSASVDYQRAIAVVSKGEDSVDLESQGTKAAEASGMLTGAAGAAAIGVVAANPQTAHADIANNINPDDAFASESNTGTEKDFSGFDVATTPNQNNLQDAGQDSMSQPQYPAQNYPDDGFEKWSQASKEAAYNPKKKRSPGKIVLIVILLLLAASIIACSGLFALGFGFPSQEMVTKTLFENPLESKDKCFSDSLTSSKVDGFISMLSQDSSPTIKGVTRSVNDSCVYVSGTTQQGGEVEYKIKMERHLLGWKITNIELAFASRND